MDSSNIILQLPFDEQAGSSVAYDYSQSRADGVVSGATFVAGRNGNALSFPGNGTCEVSANVLDISGNWTIQSWVQASVVDVGTPSMLIWLLAFSGENNYREITMHINPGVWYAVALVRDGTHYTAYLDGSVVDEFSIGGTLTGVSLNQDYYGGDYGRGLLDDVVVWRAALSQAEIVESLAATKQPEYTIDGVDMREFGVYVSASDGIMDRPARKNPYSISFDNYHGEMVDLNHNYVGVREITLSCFLKADTKMEFIRKITQFEQQFDKTGTNRLVIDVHPVKPLIYEVYMKDRIKVKKEWSDDIMVGTFTMDLIEAEPVKRVLKHIKTSSATGTCTITMKCAKYCNIYWGDGEVTYDVCGDSSNAQTITHEYTNTGDYFPVITGCIDEISEFSTNAIVVWSKL